MKAHTLMAILSSVSPNKDVVFLCNRGGTDLIIHVEESDDEIVLSGDAHWVAPKKQGEKT